MIVEKITEPKTHLECNDLTPSQKKVLFAVMAKYGALQYFAYDRFFKEGFHEWELKGINQIKRDFIDAHRAELSALVDAERTEAARQIRLIRTLTASASVGLIILII